MEGERHGGGLIERTLIIMREPLRKILYGEPRWKTWEMRSRPTRIRGTIALSEKGAKLIVGTCVLKECKGPLTAKEYARNHRKMGFTKSEVMEDRSSIRREARRKRLYAWVLSDIRPLVKPVPFKIGPGPVVWAKIPTRIARKLPRVRH